MKNILLISVLMLYATPTLVAQTFTEKITKELSFEKKEAGNTVVIANLNGSVNVSEYAGNTVLVEIEKTVKAKTQTALDEIKNQIKSEVVNLNDTLIVYTSGTCQTFGRSKRKQKDWLGWNYEWNGRDKDCREAYTYTMNIVVKVPAGTNVNASTINNGDILIENTSGKVDANNINGHISLVNLVQAAKATSINGNINVSYKQNPEQACRFYSLNGTINANFVSGLTAELGFQSMNGNLYTNIDNLSVMPSRVERTPKGSGVVFKVLDNHFLVRKGGTLLDFETFNGNVYLKEN